MTGFYFSSVPKFKIRRGRVMNDTSPSPPVSHAASVLEIAVRNVPKAMANNPPPVLLVPEMTPRVTSVLFHVGPMSPPEASGQSGKRKAIAGGGEETTLPGQSTEDGRKSQKVRHDRESPSSEAEDCFSKDRGAAQASTLHPVSRNEYINIGSCRDELDPTILGNLPISAATTATSVYKYWTLAFEKAIDNAELTKLLKLAKMYTFWSHVLNCELYKVLATKIEELRSMPGRDEDVDVLRSDNKDLQKRLAFSEDARARAVYDVAKAQTIQKTCLTAQRKAKL
ncbi:hypothetical protein Adt_45341 [Abeliophyllum distichum]|uniref:Uncharacterized protein n=1 Tax=Abeliophyllum distichum TaxID=126358 RepID=A0ABD1PH73_9LAMI